MSKNHFDCVDKNFIPSKRSKLNHDAIHLKPNDFYFPGTPMENNDIERKKEKNIYRPELLNDKQRKIFDYVLENPNSIINIQGGTGSGKTFLLKTIAYNCEQKTNVVIYKHNLLHEFRFIAERCTYAKFMMRLLNIPDMYEFNSYEIKLASEKFTIFKFLMEFIKMLRNINFPKFENTILLIDEYTIMSKPLLLVTLMLLEHHKISAIICGDHYTLQSFHNSEHTNCSSYTIVKSFAKKSFRLTKNERCSDTHYDEIIKYIAKFSSDDNLDHFAFALLAVLFPQQVFEKPDYFLTHLAYEHSDLTKLARILVKDNNYRKESYYQIDANGCPREYMKMTKFLEFLPLVIDGRYYINDNSENSLGYLRAINDDGTFLMEYDDGSKVTISKCHNADVFYSKHLDEININNNGSSLYGYPIYPANFMTIHKSQGCTLTNDLNLILTKGTSYYCLYVALSRVKKPEQIRCIDIPNHISYLASAIINFPELTTNTQITVEMLKERFVNYKFFDCDDDVVIQYLVEEFIESNDPAIKIDLRKKLCDAVSKCPKKIIWHRIKTDPDTHSTTMNHIIENKEIFKILASINEIDCEIWLKEYLKLVNLNKNKWEDSDDNESEDSESSDNESIDNSTSSKFSKRVRQMYKKNEKITLDWLTNELNSLSVTTTK